MPKFTVADTIKIRAGQFDPEARDRGDYCKDGTKGCFCKTGWPLEETCSACREIQDSNPTTYRDSCCICGPDDDKMDRLEKMDIKITGPGPGPDIPRADEARVARMVDELTPIQRAGLEIMLAFKCHGAIEHPSAVSHKLEKVLVETYGDDLQPMLTDIFARLR